MLSSWWERQYWNQVILILDPVLEHSTAAWSLGRGHWLTRGHRPDTPKSSTAKVSSEEFSPKWVPCLEIFWSPTCSSFICLFKVHPKCMHLLRSMSDLWKRMGLDLQLKAKERDMGSSSCQGSPWRHHDLLHQLGYRQGADGTLTRLHQREFSGGTLQR